jgi:Sugar kinases, ribokinase family
MKKGFVVGMGEVLFDLLPAGKQIGGAPVNFIYHISRLGYDGLAVSAIGDDALGRDVIDRMLERNIRHQFAVVDKPTGTVKVTLDAAGSPTFDITRNVAWDFIPVTPELAAAARRCDAFCFGTLAQREAVSRDAIQFFLDTMDKDSIRVYDVNLRQHYYSKELIERSLRKSTIFKVNDDEYRILSGMLGFTADNYETGAEFLLSNYGLETVILTCGATGSYIFAKNDKSYLDTPNVQVVDAVGAGDSFTAAYCAAIFEGKDMRTAHREAVELAAYVCTKAGAMPEMNR